MRPSTKWPTQGVGHRGGLLGDLLEHEVLVAALLGGTQVPVDVEIRGTRIIAVAVEVEDLIPVGGDHHGLVLAQFDRVAGVLDERRHIRADEHLPVADAQHQRGGPAGGHDGARLVGVGEHQREMALQPAQHGQHRGGEITGGLANAIGPGDQVHGHLGVGVAGELHAVGFQLTTQRGEVFDDPVVHDRDLDVGVAMRVRVAVGGPAMRGPAGMAQPGVPAQRSRVGFVQCGFEVGQPAGAPAHR